MGCNCRDEKKVVFKIRKVGAILKGTVSEALDLSPSDSKERSRRIDTCLACDDHTHLFFKDWIAFLARHKATPLDDLEKLPKLPKEEWAKGKQFWCRICKCRIRAKARQPGEKCTVGKWAK